MEDNSENLALVELALRRRKDIQLVPARNGQDGVAIAKTERPDLILMDLHMPVMDGWNALLELKRDPQVKQIPVIALTADAMKETREVVLAKGFSDYMVKPLDLNQFFETLDNWLYPEVNCS